MFTIRQARKLADMTQAEMAKQLGVCKDKYAKIEKNPDTATIKQAKEICMATGISMDKIFFGNNST
jgi:DNA-binding XRE family transcriptional regulator